MSYTEKIVEKIATQYNAGKSAREVGEALDISWRKVIYLMNKYGIARRTRSDASYLQHNKQIAPYKIKVHLSGDEEKLKGLALGLLWADGYKGNPYTLRAHSADDTIINILISFLILICGVPREKIRISLATSDERDVKQIERWWSEKLKISLSQFYKTTVFKKREKDSHKRRRRAAHGVATLHIHNVKLVKILHNWINQYALVAQTVEHMHGKHEVIGSIPIEGSIASA